VARRKGRFFHIDNAPANFGDLNHLPRLWQLHSSLLRRCLLIDKNLRESGKPENEAVEKIFPDSRNFLSVYDLGQVVGEVGEDFAEYSEEENIGHFDGQAEASATVVVALDTETEPFTDKYAQSKTWVEFRKTGKMILAP
jgi:hypothetical protein